ncbi:Sodium:neurotransmitter symporter family protein [Dictyocaulus viviparus]|uniref:Sodium:neurotransmitter symporter family protein n=1 Tax=Dictyocaulus viviparus TaxID=29172 RepID=A0A0D8XUN3_DICVI|nr:Sodium:neurotransmitter symporter family protein [Dictyocaulus viviparus]
MRYGSLWSFIFFAMLITLGIDSTFAGIEALITGLCDEWRLLHNKREWFVGVVCILYYFGSLPAISYGGQYVIPFIDEYGVSLSLLFIVTCEMVAVCWFYGIDRFTNDIKTMLGFYPGIYWRVCWMMCPVFISVIFFMTIWQVSFSPMQLSGYTFPKWSVRLGWFFRLLSVTSVPLYAIYVLSSARGTLTEVILT